MNQSSKHFKSRRFFHWQAIVCLLIWVCSAFFSLKIFRATTHEERMAYKQLMQQGNHKKSEESASYHANQQRFNVKKHLFLSENHQRLQYRLTSESSELVLNQEQNKSELVERFKALKCLVQEELVTNPEQMQLLRYIEADTATYHYKNQILVADQVLLARFQAPGHHLLNSTQHLKPMMSGKAKRIHLSLSHLDRTFKAQSFQATFQDLGKAL